MKASELIKNLQAGIDEVGDLNIRLICDHGQSLMSPSGCGKGYIEDESEWMGDEIAEEDIEDYPDATPIIVIEAF